MPWNLSFLKNMFQNGQDGRVREVDLGAFYIKSHGTKLAKSHKHDWLILVLLAVIEIILNIIHPFYRFVGKDMMTDLRYPMKENTVPVWSVPLYAVLLPILVFTFFYLRRRDVHDLHHAILGLLFSVLITGVITDAIKDAVGRPRPDFFWRCFPDGIDNYDKWGNVICHGEEKDIREGHKSFPSGHTSWSFAGLGFLALYLSGKIKVFDRRGHIAKLCILFLPLLMASLVAVSRVDDYWHHWQDVFAGGILGLVVATMCYLQFFPAPYHSEGWGPYAYFRALEETNSPKNRQSVMAPPSTTDIPSPKKSLGFIDNALKRKHSFIQFFAMTGILLLSMRSVGQKYRIKDLQDDTAALEKEHSLLTDRINHIRSSLLAESELDSTGTFAAKLRALFGDD